MSERTQLGELCTFSLHERAQNPAKLTGLFPSGCQRAAWEFSECGGYFRVNYRRTNLDWISGPDEPAGLTPHAVSIAEKREYALMQMRAYVWSGGGTRPPWSY